MGDFNGDGKQDLVVSFPQSDQVGLLLGNGDGTFKPLVSYPVDRNPRWVGVADFNGDGKLDLVTANTRSGDVSVLLGNGDGTFRPAVNLPAGQRPNRGVVGDFNRDGKLDLAILNASSPTTSATINVLLGNGDGTFQASQPYPIGGNPRSIVVADFDGDGKLDLAVDVDASATNTPSLAVLRGNGDGTFQPPIQFAKWVALTTVFEMAVGDFNNDRKPDVAVANGTSGNTAHLSVLINTRTAAAAPAIISHLADGGVLSNGGQWSTTILLVNADMHTASYQLNFHQELDGSPLVLPLLSYGSRSSVTGKIAPGQLAVIQTEGSGSALVEGWAELVTSDAIGGTGIFTDRGATGSRQEAAVPLNSTGGTQLFIPFDETFGSVVFATGIALANPGTSQANVAVRFIDDSGNTIPTATNQITLNPGAHKAFVLTWPQYFPEVNGKRGAVEFKSNVPIYGLGIRFNGTAFTSISAIVP